MANITKIFVIIVTYKGHQWYERCFTSLRNSKYPVQTIVIDNASNDGTVEYIRDHFPEIHLIESQENLGFGRANNIGMRYALDHGCDYVFLLNQDAWIESNTLGELLHVHKKNPEYALLSPMHLTKDKKAIESGLVNYLNDHKITDVNFFQDLYFGRMQEVYESKYINAAAWLLPRETLEVVGGFDPIFFHYEEDDDYINRLLYHGLKIGILPKVRIIHDHQKSFTILSNEQLTYRRHQFLLLRFTNLNNTESLARYCCYLVKKIVIHSIRCQWKKVEIWYADLLFLIKMKRSIQYSRRVNRIKQMSWI